MRLIRIQDMEKFVVGSGNCLIVHLQRDFLCEIIKQKCYIYYNFSHNNSIECGNFLDRKHLIVCPSSSVIFYQNLICLDCWFFFLV